MNSMPRVQLPKLLGEIAQRLGCIAPFGRQRTFVFGPFLGCRTPKLRRQIEWTFMIDGERGRHEAAPDFRRNRSAADLAKRRVVIASNPHADDKIARESDEQRVPVFLSRTCLSKRGDGQCGAMAGPVVRGGVEEVEYR